MSADTFLAAAVAAGYPDAAARARLAAAAAEGFLPAAAAALLAADPAELESEYLRLFEFGVAENPLHETGYGRDRSLAVGERLADVAGFYRAFGVDGAGAERLDHLAVELEFYGWLILKQEHLAAAEDAEGVAIVGDARRKFLGEHLGPLAVSVALRPQVAAHPLYGPLFEGIAGSVVAEGVTLAVPIAPLAILPARAEPDEVTCAVAENRAGGGPLPVVSG